MKKYLKIAALALTAVALMLQFSCTIESIKPALEVDPVLMADADLEEAMIVEDILDEVISDLERYDFLKSADICPTVTIERPDSTRYPKIITKDFGDSCVSKWGTVKTGKIIIRVTGPWLEEGSKRYVSFEDYTHRGIAISGEKVITCKGLDADGFYKHVVRGTLTLEKPNGIIAKREIHKRRYLIAGAGDKEVLNEYLVDGYAKVQRSDSVCIEMNITEPLHKIQGCKWPQSGMKVLHFWVDDGLSVDEGAKDNEYTRKVVIDYSYEEGDRTCDRFALKWIDEGEPDVIKLKK